MKIAFLYSAINDAQELIKYTESKAGFAIGLLTGIIAGLFVSLDDFLQVEVEYSWLIWIVFSILCIGILASFWIIVMIINPIKAPFRHIENLESELTNSMYFLTPNLYPRRFKIPYCNLPDSKLSISRNSFHKSITALDENQIIKQLSHELLKISFIRNIKTDRFKSLLTILIITTIAFMAYFVILQMAIN